MAVEKGNAVIGSNVKEAHKALLPPNPCLEIMPERVHKCSRYPCPVVIQCVQLAPKNSCQDSRLRWPTTPSIVAPEAGPKQSTVFCPSDRGSSTANVGIPAASQDALGQVRKIAVSAAIVQDVSYRMHQLYHVRFRRETFNDSGSALASGRATVAEQAQQTLEGAHPWPWHFSAALACFAHPLCARRPLMLLLSPAHHI